MLEYVNSGEPVELWTASDIREDSPEDADRIDDDAIGVLFHSGDHDGALVIGTPASVMDYLDDTKSRIQARITPHVSETATAIELDLLVYGFTAQEQVDSLREAIGMLPGEMGRWKGGDKLLISGGYVAAAIDWARRHGRTYELCRTERFAPR